ncbi:CobQ/CobB/MinD/ParA nucleotide binding domain [Dillenia turbinata]|uniref:CobQ/CobB/MinD/ParA nucleotide binding domain n=1 Tax=Dillenia turbinata TaxID=194707 RepID=A0AAN8VYV4_9MAGN
MISLTSSNPKLSASLHTSTFTPNKTLESLKPPIPRISKNPTKHTIRSVLQWNRKPELAGETPRVVVITSGKGGVGKTTTTANVGLSLARLGFSVVAIDADVGLRNLDLLLGLENRVNYTAVEVLNGDCRLDQALVRDKRWSNFELLCISKPRSKLPLGFGGKALIWLVDALKGRQEGCPDFILIDCPAGIDAGFITAITPANEAVLVTTPDITSLRDADRVTGLLECDGIKDIKMIVNRVRTDMIRGEDMMSVLDVQEMLGLALLGVIPEDSEVIRSTNRGYPLVLNKPPTLAGLAFEQAAWRLVEQDSMKAVMLLLEECEQLCTVGLDSWILRLRIRKYVGSPYPRMGSIVFVRFGGIFVGLLMLFILCNPMADSDNLFGVKPDTYTGAVIQIMNHKMLRVGLFNFHQSFALCA